MTKTGSANDIVKTSMPAMVVGASLTRRQLRERLHAYRHRGTSEVAGLAMVVTCG